MAAARRPQQQQQRPQQPRPASSPRSAPGPQRVHAPRERERDPLDEILREDDGISIVKPDFVALEALTKSEVSMQLEAAHRWPRRINDFLNEATDYACHSRETAESCMFTLPPRRGGVLGPDGKPVPITGPSVRLAEICAVSWRNLHTGSRIIDEGPRTITAQAIAWDLEKNMRLSVEVQRGIVTNRGERFGDSMIQTTMMAAISIAFRNAIFRIIPRALINQVYEESKRFAVGDDKELPKRRDAIIGWLFHKRGVSIERIFERCAVKSVDQMTREHVEMLIGFAQSIKDGTVTADEAFPSTTPAEPGPAKSKGSALDDLTEQHKKKSEPPANDALTPAVVLAALAAADEAWDDLTLEKVVADWSPAEQRIAYDWAVAYNDPTTDDDKLPERPEFTVRRQPGEEG